MTLFNLLVITTISWLISILIVTVTLPLHSILFLIGLFTFVGICFITIFNLTFIGTILIIVYVGAVAVLFIFVIIIIPQRVHGSEKISSKQITLTLGTIFCSLTFMIILLLYLLPTSFNDLYEIVIIPGVQVEEACVESNVISLSTTLYYEYPILLVLAALLLFIAMAVAILICRESEE